jgi:hypothetical protein
MALNTADEILNSVLPEWHTPLQGWAADGSLVAAAQEALILPGEPEALTNLVAQWSGGVQRHSTDRAAAFSGYELRHGGLCHQHGDDLAWRWQSCIANVVSEAPAKTRNLAINVNQVEYSFN